MREILFRGKHKDNGEWIEGFYAELGVGDDKEYYIIQNNALCQIFEDPELNKTFSDYEVDLETVGEFTGLIDKNGKKIFEGDILRDKHGLIRAVKWEMSCGSCCTQVVGFGASGNGHLDYIYLDGSDGDIEIIGNIHDNPELLEGEKNAVN